VSCSFLLTLVGLSFVLLIFLTLEVIHIVLTTFESFIAVEIVDKIGVGITFAQVVIFVVVVDILFRVSLNALFVIMVEDLQTRNKFPKLLLVVLLFGAIIFLEIQTSQLLKSFERLQVSNLGNLIVCELQDLKCLPILFNVLQLSTTKLVLCQLQSLQIFDWWEVFHRLEMSLVH